MMMGYAVEQVIVYPVKGCRGVSVSSAAISSTGFLYDREWMVVSADKGRLIAMVVAPKIGLVQPSLPEEAFRGEVLSPKAALEIRAPGMPVLKVPINRNAANVERRPVVDVFVYQWHGKGMDEGPEAASWWSTFLDRPARLVRFNPRIVDRQVEHAPEGFKTGFTNAAQFLVVSEASLEDLNQRLPDPVAMNRFRPNLIIRGPPAFEEDKWQRFSILHSGRSSVFTFVKSCARCKATTVDQDNPAAHGEEPLKTLDTFRTGETLGVKIGHRKQVFFGTYFVSYDTLLHKESPSEIPARVAVRDPLNVLEFH